MAQRTHLTRGDRRRNEKIGALRAVVRVDRAILSIDLGEDKQVAALMAHDGRVLGRRVVQCEAHALGGLLEWAGAQGVKHGFAGVLVGREPAGHRWRSVMALADEAGMGFVCARSLKVRLPGVLGRTGPGCGIWGSTGSGWPVRRPGTAIRSVSCCRAAGQRRW
ncbi:MAG TPA: hypothetical protein VFO16_10800 [Pseudonocardiaceae bacterium]|nr:hypothetical protein [Pseudonocardiaceae bacterium]